MMWLFFFGGMLLGGALTAALLIWLLLRWEPGDLSYLQVLTPDRHEIHSRKALQGHLARVLRTADSRRANYLSRVPDGLQLCVRRYARKSRADALVVDVPRSTNPEHYERFREVLAAQDIPFDEHVTPKRRTPKLLRVKFEDVDKGIAAEATEVVCLLYRAAHGEGPLELALEYA